VEALKFNQSDLVDLTVRAGGRTVDATMGLGTAPAVAEEIISSFRPT
jgi:hypothetical protein